MDSFLHRRGESRPPRRWDARDQPTPAKQENFLRGFATTGCVAPLGNLRLTAFAPRAALKHSPERPRFADT